MKIRIGNDLHITWTLKDCHGDPYILEGHDFGVYAQVGNKKILIDSLTVSANVLYFTFYGKDQQYIGEYNLLLIENNGKIEMLTYDVKTAFELVAHSWETDTVSSKGIVIESTTVDSDICYCGERNVINIIRVNDVALIPDDDRAVDIYVPTDEERSEWSAKYTLPDGGIPETDLELSVREALARATDAIVTTDELILDGGYAPITI